MSELWGEPSDAASEWSMPGDAEIEARLAAEAPGAPAPEPEAAPEPVAEPEAEKPSRERNELGQFVPKEQEQEPEQVEVEPETQAEREERLYAGKYRSDEELERGYQELRSLQDRTAQEREQYRLQLEAIQAQQQAAQAQPPQTQQQVDWQGLLESDPSAAADYAREIGNEYAYRQALDAMSEEYGPGFVRMYERTARAEWAAHQARLAQQESSAPIQQRLEQDRWQEAIMQFAAENEWFNDIPDQDIIEAGKRNKIAAEIVQNGTTESKLEALRLLALDAQHMRGRQNGDTLATAREVAKAQAQATIEAKNEAILASATANTDGGPKLSPAEQFAEQLGAQWEARRAAFDDGWNV